MKAVIIDDEPKARNILKILIEENCPKITEIFTADNLLSGVDLIQTETANIVFLDIEMPEHSGLEILNFIDRSVVNFEIIFTTAYDEYAIQAFQLAAIDYLLKPVSASQVKDAVEKCISLIGRSHINVKLEELKENLTASGFTKIGLPMSKGIRFVEFEKIIMMEAEGMYTNVKLVDTEDILLSKPLKHFVELLKKNALFYRPHRSFLINLQYMSEYIKSDGGYIVMSHGKTVSVSRENKEDFLRVIGSL